MSWPRGASTTPASTSPAGGSTRPCTPCTPWPSTGRADSAAALGGLTVDLVVADQGRHAPADGVQGLRRAGAADGDAQGGAAVRSGDDGGPALVLLLEEGGLGAEPGGHQLGPAGGQRQAEGLGALAGEVDGGVGGDAEVLLGEDLEGRQRAAAPQPDQDGLGEGLGEGRAVLVA